MSNVISSEIPIFGVPSLVGRVKNSLQDASAVHEIYNPTDILETSPDLAVGAISDSMWNYDQEKVESYIYSFIESSIKSHTSKELVILYQLPSSIVSEIDSSNKINNIKECFTHILTSLVPHSRSDNYSVCLTYIYILHLHVASIILYVHFTIDICYPYYI